MHFLRRIKNKLKIPFMPVFGKEERLCNKEHILRLQKDANVFYDYPYTVKWMEISDPKKSGVRILTAVPKRNFKKAVDRNKIKRFIREAYRINKEFLVEKTKLHNKNIIVMLLYSGKKIVSFKESESKIILILQRIANNQ
jgi:ribonuclease P protein component